MRVAYNYRKLQGRIVEKFGTQSAFSKAMGCSERTLSCKLNNIVKFNQDEIEKACTLLDIQIDQVHSYFFALDSQFD